MLHAGQVVDRYRVESMLGQGGMATVYRVRHVQLESDRALKVMSLTHPALRGRLLREGRLQAGLSHPNVVGVADVLEVGGAPALLMEYVAGPSLEQWLHHHAPSLDEALALFRDVVAGVAYAHERGLVHRDLKPANVLLVQVDGRLVAKVADFGLAKVVEDEVGVSGATRTGTGMGTPAYMAPEQIRDAKRVDQRADVFALGCILYELCCGQRAFGGEDLLSLLTAIAAGDYTTPRALVPDLPREVEVTILGCLVADREQRLPDCRAVLESLPPARPVRWSTGALRAAAPPPEQALPDGGPPPPVLAPSTTASSGGGRLPTGPASPDSASRVGASPETWMPATGPAPPPRTLVPGAGGTLSPASSPGLPAPSSLASLPPGTGLATPAPGGGGWKAVAGIAAVVALGAVAWAFADRADRDDPARQEEVATPAAALRATPAPEVGGNAPPPPTVGETAADPEEGSAAAVDAPPEPPAVEATTPARTGSPAAAPAAAPASSPTAAPASSPTAAAPVDGTVQVTGDAEAVTLRGAAGTYAPGPVPPGVYEIVATFPGRAPAAAGRVTVPSGKQVVLRCTSAFVKCVP